MKVDTIFHSFNLKDTNTPRHDAAEWMENVYKEYGKRVISSNFAEDSNSVTAYATILNEPLIKL